MVDFILGSTFGHCHMHLYEEEIFGRFQFGCCGDHQIYFLAKFSGIKTFMIVQYPVYTLYLIASRCYHDNGNIPSSDLIEDNFISLLHSLE